MEVGVFFTAGEGAVDIAQVARAAAVTQRLRIGTRVCLLPLREPIALAKDIATLARIAAWGDGWIPGMSSAAEIREGRDKLVAAAAAGDRDPADFTVVAFGLPGALIQ